MAIPVDGLPCVVRCFARGVETHFFKRNVGEARLKITNYDYFFRIYKHQLLPRSSS